MWKLYITVVYMILGQNTRKCFFTQVSLSKPGIDNQRILLGGTRAHFYSSDICPLSLQSNLIYGALPQLSPSFFFPNSGQSSLFKSQCRTKSTQCQGFLFFCHISYSTGVRHHRDVLCTGTLQLVVCCGSCTAGPQMSCSVLQDAYLYKRTAARVNMQSMSI